MAQPPQEWFLNTPVLWLAAFVLISILRGPLRNAPTLLKKTLKFAVVSGFAVGLTILLTSDASMQMSKSSPILSIVWFLLMGISTVGWMASFFWIFLSRSRLRDPVTAVATAGNAPRPQVQPAVRAVPSERFADLCSLDDVKEQILVQGHLNPGKYERYGLVRNGVLLYGRVEMAKPFRLERPLATSDSISNTSLRLNCLRDGLGRLRKTSKACSHTQLLASRFCFHRRN